MPWDFFAKITRLVPCLQDMEEAAATLNRSIDAGRKDKSQLLADIVDTEKQVSCSPLLPPWGSQTSQHGFSFEPQH